jgi:hypothetical protein
MKIELDFADLINIGVGLATLESSYVKFISMESTPQETRDYYKQRLEEIRKTQKKIQDSTLK